MQRTQISITSDQARRLKRAAAGRDVSMAHIIREAIDAYVAGDSNDREALVRRARAAAGRFSSDSADVSERHDDYLAEDPRGW